LDNPTPLAIKKVPLGSIHLDPANVRRHDEGNLEAIKGSLARFGQQKPIVVDRDGIIRAGNGTYAAAKALGWPELYVVETELAGIEATAYAIADNRTSDLSSFDDAALAKLLLELQAEDALDGVGFTDAELDELLEGLTNEVPDLPRHRAPVAELRALEEVHDFLLVAELAALVLPDLGLADDAGKPGSSG
jgi:ParB-like chromosome segregation protein Spo0J